MRAWLKRTVILLLLLTVAVGGALAVDFSLGFSGALYMSDEQFDNSSGRSILERFGNGEGIFYGVNGEILFDQWALGLYTYFSFYEFEYTYFDSTYKSGRFEMMDVDVNLSLSYHFFRARAVLDPFAEFGAGVISSNVNAVYEDGAQIYGSASDEEPLMILGTEYVFAGLGLGLNLGDLGLFTKLQYHTPVGTPEGEIDNKDGTVTNYEVDEFPLNDLKVILGLKLFL
ncbi:MAG: hypothetical protein K9L66_01595 [Spirochaetaceae bacterium]|nr:hypothetical protein [Spirochaetaceae bacterium]MCF7947373.1 hypothetical protein [Spirochaetia bacterium]MCF7950309.1 hypothetical protein [Spirochaetaceae bacterium]